MEGVTAWMTDRDFEEAQKQFCVCFYGVSK